MANNNKVYIMNNYNNLNFNDQEQLLRIILENEHNYKQTGIAKDTNNGSAINLDKCSTETINLLYKYIYSIIVVNNNTSVLTN